VALAATAAMLVAWCVTALNLNDYRAETLRLEGMQRAGAGDGDGAEEALRAAARLAPRAPEYLVDLAGLCMARAESVAPAPGAPLSGECRAWLAEAEANLRRAIRMEPADYQSYLRLGPVYSFWASFEPDKVERGLQLYRDAAATSPGRQHIHWEWGDFYLAVGRREAALERYRHAVALDPSVAASHRELAKLYVKLGDPRAAEHSYESAWALELQHIDPASIHYPELAPRRAAEHETLAELFLRTGDRSRAAHHLRETLALNRENSRARELLAQIAAAPLPGEQGEG
jgi:Tfp pilus assembly protein PilF